MLLPNRVEELPGFEAGDVRHVLAYREKPIATDAFEVGENLFLGFEMLLKLAVFDDDVVIVPAEGSLKPTIFIPSHCVALASHLDERTVLGIAIQTKDSGIAGDVECVKQKVGIFIMDI